MKMNEIYFVN